MNSSPRAGTSAPPDHIHSLSAAWNKAANAPSLDHIIRSIQETLTHLHDSDHGRVGAEFQERMQNIGCQFKPTDRNYSIATFRSFLYDAQNAANSRFQNMIAFSPKARHDRHTLFSAYVHEGSHAIQMASAPALHASPYNAATRIVLCPRDWALVQERCEQSSYARQTWFNTLLARHDGHMRKNSHNDPYNVSKFESVLNRYNRTMVALRHAAVRVLRKPYYALPPDNGEPIIRFSDHYHFESLLSYDNVMHLRKGKEGANFIFVRVEPDDILAIGDGCGPNIFARKSGDKCAAYFTRRPKLSALNENFVSRINEKLGIPDDRVLPTLREALETTGMTRDEFLKSTYGTITAGPSMPRSEHPEP